MRLLPELKLRLACSQNAISPTWMLLRILGALPRGRINPIKTSSKQDCSVVAARLLLVFWIIANLPEGLSGIVGETKQTFLDGCFLPRKFLRGSFESPGDLVKMQNWFQEIRGGA